MSRSFSRSRREQANYWPGFVDALSTLLLVIIFLLAVFMLAQYFLGQALSGRDEALQRLNAQIAELGDLLALERQTNLNLRQSLEQMQASLTLNEQKLLDAEAAASAAQVALADAETRLGTMGGTLDDEKELSEAAQNQAKLLNQQVIALRQQIAALQAALDAAEARDEEQQAVIADLGKRLNAALAQKVQELSRYRSEFFGRLREILQNRSGVEIVGDRFVFPSEILFDSASAELNVSGKQELRKLAVALNDIAARIPPDLNWVMRVDGHTDKAAINTPEFPSNWHLSASRAISVVNFLISQGVPGDRLVAAGFGEFHPLDPGNTPEAYRRNRRIELKLTER